MTALALALDIETKKSTNYIQYGLPKFCHQEISAMSENREFYRTKMNSPGYLISPSGEVQFQVQDLSLKGFLAHFDNAPSCEKGAMVRVRLPALDIVRSAMVIRIKADKEGGYKVGFLFCESAATPPASFIPGKGLSDEDDLMDLLF